MYIGEAWKTTSPHVGKGISLRIRYNVRYPDSGNRQIFASGIRNPRSSAQEIRRNPETRNPETCTGNPGSTTWNSDHPRLSWIYLTLPIRHISVVRHHFLCSMLPYQHLATCGSWIHQTSVKMAETVRNFEHILLAFRSTNSSRLGIFIYFLLVIIKTKTVSLTKNYWPYNCINNIPGCLYYETCKRPRYPASRDFSLHAWILAFTKSFATYKPQENMLKGKFKRLAAEVFPGAYRTKQLRDWRRE